MRTKLKKLIIEQIHGLPYDEALVKEAMITNPKVNIDTLIIAPITIGRVMQALDCSFKFGKCFRIGTKMAFLTKEVDGVYRTVNWQLTKENGQECTNDDQSDETIEALYNLLK